MHRSISGCPSSMVLNSLVRPHSSSPVPVGHCPDAKYGTGDYGNWNIALILHCKLPEHRDRDRDRRAWTTCVPISMDGVCSDSDVPRGVLRDHLLPIVSILNQFSVLNTERALHMPSPNPSFITGPVSGLALHEMTARCGILPMAVNVNLTHSFCSAYHALCTKVILHTTIIIVPL